MEIMSRKADFYVADCQFPGWSYLKKWSYPAFSAARLRVAEKGETFWQDNTEEGIIVATPQVRIEQVRNLETGENIIELPSWKHKHICYIVLI